MEDSTPYFWTFVHPMHLIKATGSCDCHLAMADNAVGAAQQDEVSLMMMQQQSRQLSHVAVMLTSSAAEIGREPRPWQHDERHRDNDSICPLGSSDSSGKSLDLMAIRMNHAHLLELIGCRKQENHHEDITRHDARWTQSQREPQQQAETQQEPQQEPQHGSMKQKMTSSTLPDSSR